MHGRAIGVIAVVLLASAAPAALAASGGSAAIEDSATSAQTSAGAGASVDFETTGSAVVDYAVDGETVAESVRVQGESAVESGLSLSADVGLQAVTGIAGADLSIASDTGLQTTVQADSGATLTSHADDHGSLVIAGGDESQYVEVGLAESASAEADGENRVVVTEDDGTTATVLAVGDAAVDVNDDGNVTGNVDGDGRVVVRAYPDGRDDGDRAVEDLLANGESAASVYLTGEGDGAVTYDDSTSASVEERTEGHVELAVERTVQEGTVVVTSAAEETFASAEDVEVTVDGEAAVEAASMADLRQAADDGETSSYVVRGAGDADATVQVLVAVDHFSTRQITVSDDADSGDDAGAGSDGDDGSPGNGDEDTTGADGPGFGALGAVTALLTGSFVARQLS